MPNSPSNKKFKRLVTFNKSWTAKYEWIRPGKDAYTAKCVVCNNRDFTISHGGENDVTRHLKSNTHIEHLKAAAGTSKLTNIFSQVNSSDENDVAFAEASFCYHSVMHSHSYISTGCVSNLFQMMFADSKTAKKYSCGKTKTAAIVTNVLGPASREIVLNQLADDRYFSISTDASNKGNIKTFPLILRYFHPQKGIQNSLLSFYSLEAEDSTTISESLLNNLHKHGLSIKNVTAYGADNANVNFGKTNSVYTALKKHNENILPVGCNLHILHNTAKHATNILKIDIETVVIKIYNEFSSSTKKTAQLKEFFEWTETEWCELLRHVPTRWLTLIPAIERLLGSFEAIKAYFMSQNNLSGVLRSFFEDELGKAYLGFTMNACNVFEPALRKLQGGNEVLIVEVSIIYFVLSLILKHISPNRFILL